MKNNITTVKATERDIALLGMKGFRDIDERECQAMSGRTALEAAFTAVEVSYRSWIGHYKYEPFCVFGFVIADPVKSLGIPWMLGTNDVKRAGHDFVRVSMIHIETMLTECSKLENFVHEENRDSIDWLRYCGFIIDDAAPMGVKNELFRKFHMDRSAYV